MIRYAEYVSITDNTVLIMMQIIKEKLSDGTAKKIILAACDSVIAGLQKAYDIFHDGYEAAEKGEQPDFSGEIPFPDKPPAPPPDGDSISWFQLSWNIVKNALNLAASKSSKLGEILPILEAAGNKLVDDLNKYFGKPKSDAGSLIIVEDIPDSSEFASFPTLTSRR